MAPGRVRDLTLLLDVTPHKEKPWEYAASLFEGWPEEDRKLTGPGPQRGFEEIFQKVDQQASDDYWGRILFDWAFPPQRGIRKAFLGYAEEVGERGEQLRLWVSVNPKLTTDTHFQFFERHAKVSLEGFWVCEWADGTRRPSRVRSPFLALNPWIHVLRRPPDVSVKRRFSVPGTLNVLIIVSNPPPGSHQWKHSEHLEGMLRRVWRSFIQHERVGWVCRERNPNKREIALVVRDHKPHLIVYLGHGYANASGAGLVLADNQQPGKFEMVSGLRKDGFTESELEQALAGKVETLVDPASHDLGLPFDDRPRLFIAFACEASPAAPALLHANIPAVLAMRSEIPDSQATEEMVRRFVDLLTDPSKSLEQAIGELRWSLKERGSNSADKGVHFSIPVFHLATAATKASDS